MRYILTLFLIALVSSSEIIDKADEIKEFSEYEDVELQFLWGIIPFIGKIVGAAVGLFTKAKAFIAGTKVFKFVKGAITAGSKIFKGASSFISKGRALLEKSKIFKFGKSVIDKGQAIYNKYKGIIQNSKLYKRVVGTIDKVKQSKIYQTYKKVRDTYNKGKEVYENVKDFVENGPDFNKYRGLLGKTKLGRVVFDTIDKVKESKIYQTYQKVRDAYNKGKDLVEKVKGYYEKGQDIYNKYIKKEKTPEEQSQEDQAQQQRLRQQQQLRQQQTNRSIPVQILEKNQAYQKYGQIRTSNTMTLSQKKIAINNHLNYMLSRGFITPVQKQQMSI